MRAVYQLFVFNPAFSVQLADLKDWGNLSTRLDICRRPLEETQSPITSLVEKTLALAGVEGIENGSGTLSTEISN